MNVKSESRSKVCFTCLSVNLISGECDANTLARERPQSTRKSRGQYLMLIKAMRAHVFVARPLFDHSSTFLCFCIFFLFIVVYLRACRNVNLIFGCS